MESRFQKYNKSNKSLHHPLRERLLLNVWCFWTHSNPPGNFATFSLPYSVSCIFRVCPSYFAFGARIRFAHRRVVSVALVIAQHGVRAVSLSLFWQVCSWACNSTCHCHTFSAPSWWCFFYCFSQELFYCTSGMGLSVLSSLCDVSVRERLCEGVWNCHWDETTVTMRITYQG